ncbi:MAG: exodeoxyribonuclease VII small subunit [Gammaproteobacteria bacterium]|nr:exodeoxyribonuclease VII small subunit [Gammaproteobacteria bacterium]
MTANKKKEPSFESTLGSLEAIVEQLEQGDLELDQALAQFEQGIGLARLGQQKLQQAQQKVDILMANGNDGQLQSYQQQDN